MNNKVKSVMIGHAVGDAVGVPVEFTPREELDDEPVVDMEEYGTYSMPKGSWSDDTSMALCALDAFDENKLNFDKVMRNFALWYDKDEYTPTGVMFDVGNTCSTAIENYTKYRLSWKECGQENEYGNGNGSLMRIHPFVLYTYRLETDIRTKIDIVELASALTHAHQRAKTACGIYAFILWELLDNPTKEAVNVGLQKGKEYYRNNSQYSHYARLFDANFLHTRREDIKSGGYVVDTIEAAIWCLLTTDTYRDCILKAVNLGDDTDTVAAIAGGLAGALYGYEGIPQAWRDALLRRQYIEELCDKHLPF